MTQPAQEGPVHGDQRAERVMGNILSCLCSTLSEGDRAVCCCAWVRADGAAELPMLCDATCGQSEGMAWVRLVERVFVQQEQNQGFDGGTCILAERWRIDVGVSRCWNPQLCESCESITATAADGAWDEHLIFKAMTCCKELRPYAVQPVRIRTLGPEGGCIGAVMEARITPR